jgi:hypothetical protein
MAPPLLYHLPAASNRLTAPPEALGKEPWRANRVSADATKACKRRMNRDGIKITSKIDRKTASARSLTKKTLHGVKELLRRLGLQQRLSSYGRVILSYALRASHIVTGCLGTFSPSPLPSFR